MVSPTIRDMRKKMPAYQKYLREAARRKELIIELYKKGHSQTEIARGFGISPQRVFQIVRAVFPKLKPAS